MGSQPLECLVRTQATVESRYQEGRMLFDKWGWFGYWLRSRDRNEKPGRQNGQCFCMALLPEDLKWIARPEERRAAQNQLFIFTFS